MIEFLFLFVGGFSIYLVIKFINWLDKRAYQKALREEQAYYARRFERSND